jgi:predicted nucleic acid-binding protein
VARQRRRVEPARVPTAVVLDAGALSAGAEGNPRVRAELVIAEQVGAGVHVSSVTLAEVLRGHPRDHAVYSLLGALEQHPVSPQLGRGAGELLGRAGRNDTIDALVAVTADALARPTRLLTADAGDLRVLTTEMASVTVVPI